MLPAASRDHHHHLADFRFHQNAMLDSNLSCVCVCALWAVNCFVVTPAKLKDFEAVDCEINLTLLTVNEGGAASSFLAYPRLLMCGELCLNIQHVCWLARLPARSNLSCLFLSSCSF